MGKIVFYKDINGKMPVKDFLDELAQKAQTSKHERIRIKKIRLFMNQLRQKGTFVGFPVVRHMGDGLWELRPNDDRVFFFCHCGGDYVMLHNYVKKSNKTPLGELEKAMNRMNDYIERSKQDEQ